MKDDFYKDIKHKRTQSDAEQPKGKGKEKKDEVKEESKTQEEQSFKRSAKYKDQKDDAAGKFPDKMKAYFNREKLEKGKAFFAGKLSTYNERFSNELKVTKEKLNEFRNRPKTQKAAVQDDADENSESGRNKGLMPMIIGGVIIVPVTLILGFIIISNFWPSNDGMELATDEEQTEEVAEEEEINEDLDDQRFEMERRMAESRDSEDDSGNEGEDAAEDGEDVVEDGGDLASENIDSIYSDEEVSILEDIAEVAIDEKEGGDETTTASEDAQAGDGESEDEETAEDETESAGATHVVGENDNLFQIARQYYGDGSSENVQRIRDANGISGNNISVGQELVIP